MTEPAIYTPFFDQPIKALTVFIGSSIGDGFDVTGQLEPTLQLAIHVDGELTSDDKQAVIVESYRCLEQCLARASTGPRGGDLVTSLTIPAARTRAGAYLIWKELVNETLPVFSQNLSEGPIMESRFTFLSLSERIEREKAEEAGRKRLQEAEEEEEVKEAAAATAEVTEDPGRSAVSTVDTAGSRSDKYVGAEIRDSGSVSDDDESFPDDDVIFTMTIGQAASVLENLRRRVKSTSKKGSSHRRTISSFA